jgi:hypothetical protein
MSNQSHKDKYSGTEPEKTKKLFVQCFKEQTDKQFIVDGTEWQFAEPGIGHSKDGPHMTLIFSSALDALLVQQASHKHKGMIETGQVHCRTGMDLCDLNSRVTEKLDHMIEWSQKEAWICNTLLGAVIRKGSTIEGYHKAIMAEHAREGISPKLSAVWCFLVCRSSDAMMKHQIQEQSLRLGPVFQRVHVSFNGMMKEKIEQAMEICKTEYASVSGQVIAAAVMDYFDLVSLEPSCRLMEELIELSIKHNTSAAGVPFTDRGIMANVFAMLSDVLGGAAMQRIKLWQKNKSRAHSQQTTDSTPLRVMSMFAPGLAQLHHNNAMNALGDQDCYDLCSHHRNWSGLQLRPMVYSVSDPHQELCVKCEDDDRLLAFQSRTRTRQELTEITSQQAQAGFQREYEMHCQESRTVQIGKLKQFSLRRKKGQKIGMYHQVEKSAVVHRLMLAMGCTDRFGDHDFYGALNPEIILDKVCEAEQRDLARLRKGKDKSQVDVEISFNHVEVNEMAKDQKQHREKMVRQADSTKSKFKKGGQSGSSGGRDHQSQPIKCLFCNGDHQIKECPVSKIPLTGEFDDKEYKHQYFATYSLMCRLCDAGNIRNQDGSSPHHAALSSYCPMTASSKRLELDKVLETLPGGRYFDGIRERLSDGKFEEYSKKLNLTEVSKKSSGKNKKKTKKRKKSKPSKNEASDEDSAEDNKAEAKTERKSESKKHKAELNALKKTIKKTTALNKTYVKKLAVARKVLKSELTDESFDSIQQSCADTFDGCDEDGELIVRSFFDGSKGGKGGTDD